MKEAFIGFDSAWGGHNAGAVAWAVFENKEPVKERAPFLVGYADAAEVIEELQRECDRVIIGIDQPIIVPNDADARPVDYVADSLMQHLNSGVLKANRTEKGKGFNNRYLHGDEAPIWIFMSKIGACKYSGRTDVVDACAEKRRVFVDFETAQIATRGIQVIEVYPALALPALNPIFTERGSAARYDPQSYKGPHRFNLEDWRLVCEIVRRGAAEFHLEALSQWASGVIQPWDSPTRPRKLHQDKIDAVLCLIIALQWRMRTNGVCVIGDLANGYIVTPTSIETREILEAACEERGVCFEYEGD